MEETGYETRQTSKDDLFVQVLAWSRDRDRAQQYFQDGVRSIVEIEVRIKNSGFGC